MSKVFIIGLGASGSMALSLLKEAEAIERNSEAGLKLLISGGGRCNYAPSFFPINDHYYDKKNFVSPSLSAFGPEKIREYLFSLGVESKVEKNKLFPKSDKAVTIRDALIKDCFNIHYGEKVISLEKDNGLFTIETNKTKYIEEFVIVATGGITIPQTGSDGSIFPLLRKLGHTIIPPRPALSELIIADNTLSKAEGVSLPLILKKGKDEIKGDAVLTRNGISGPVAENFSHYVDSKSEIEISFLKLDKQGLLNQNQKTLVKNSFPLPERVINAIAPKIAEKRLSDLTKVEREYLLNALNSYKANVRVNGKSAMCTKGGVDVTEINRKTMESKIVENLYITGEALDVDGECGGFNIAWAFASAYSAVNDIKRNFNPHL